MGRSRVPNAFRVETRVDSEQTGEHPADYEKRETTARQLIK